MFLDAGVFDEGWTPNDIRHRDAEASAIADGVRPLVRGQSPGPVLVWGSSGTGKTCTTQYILDDLDANEPEIQTALINCWQADNVHQLYEDIHECVVGQSPIDREHTSATKLFREVETATEGRPLVLALDEADEVEDEQLFYRFAQLRNVALVLVAYTDGSLRRSIGEERTLSRLGPMTRVPFDRYTTAQMADILWDRVRAGLETGVVDETQIEAIARTTDNAHEAIQTLETAANKSMTRGYNEIRDAVIDPANNEARRLLRERRLQYLDRHQLALYEIVSAAGEDLPRSAIGEAYRECVCDPRTSEKWVRDTLRKLASYDLIRAEGEGRGRRYGAIADAPDPALAQ